MADPSAQEQQPPAEAAEVLEVAAKPQDGTQEPAPAEQEPEPQQEQQQDAAAAPAAEGAATPAAQEDPAPQQQEQQQERPSEPEPAYPQPPPEGAAPNGAPSAAAAAAGAPKRTAEQAGLGGGADEDARPSKSLRLDGFDPAVRAKLTALVDGRVLTAADVEGSTSDTLLKLDPASGLELLDALAAAGLAGAADGPARRAMVVVTVARFAQRVKPQMDPVVKAKLEALYTTGGGPVKPGDLDERCIERLREIAPTTAAAVLDTFANKKFDYVRNVSALFMTTLKRVMSGEEGPAAGIGGPRPGSWDGYGGGGAPGGYPPAPGGYPGLPGPPGGAVGAYGGGSARGNRGAEQAALGVRVGEFHGLSPYAVAVHPQAALRLQQLWDGGNELVSLLDEKAWEALSQLDGPEAVSLVDETGGKLANGAIRNVNAFVMSVARRMISEQATARLGGGYGAPMAAPGYGAPPAAAWGGGGGGGMGGGEGALHLFSPQVRAVAEDMIRRHHPYLQRHHFDDSAVSMLMRLGERDAILILGELDHTRMESIRSMPAFIMGMVRRHSGR